MDRNHTRITLTSKRSFRRALICSAATAALLDAHGSAAMAQESDKDPSAFGGEIVVTASKRDEKLGDVPASVAVTTGEQLEAVGPVTDTGDLISAVPGARFNNLSNPVLSEVSIRGSGTQRATGADSSVGLYANGVYAGFSGSGGRNFAVIDSFDVERVEVLTGPQSALYGRNAEFGVVNIISRRPQYVSSGEVSTVYTFETNQWIGKAILNQPLSDAFSIRLGAQIIDQSGGFRYNPVLDEYNDRTSGYLVRGQIRYRTGNVDINLLAQRQDLRMPVQWSSYNWQPADPTTGFPGNANWRAGFTQDPASIPSNGSNRTDQVVDNLHLSAEYDMGWAQLVSVASYRHTNVAQMVDTDLLDVPTLIEQQQRGNRGTWPFAQRDSELDTDSYFLDIHLDGAPTMGGRLTWQVGLELLSQPQSETVSALQNPCATDRAPNLVIGQGVCGGTPTTPTCTPLLGAVCGPVRSPYGRLTTNRSRYKSWAPYVALKYDFGAGFKIGGELRYSDDRKSAVSVARQVYTGAPYPFLGGAVVPDTTYAYDDGDWTYTGTLSYQFPDGRSLVYARVGTGYRVGGFNAGEISPPLIAPPLPAGISPAVDYAPATPQYDAEHSMAYEVGFKSNLTPRTFITLAAYRQVTKDALASVNDGCSPTNACGIRASNYVVNAGTVRGYGFEGQLSTGLDFAGGKLAFNLSASHQIARYREIPTVGPTGQKLNGLPIVDTDIAQNPKWLLDATVNYKRPIAENMRGFFNLRYHGQWGGFQDPTVSALSAFRMDDFQTVDLRTGVQIGRVDLALIVRNLTNETHRLAQFQQNGTNTITGEPVAVTSQQRVSLPRTIGVEATYSW